MKDLRRALCALATACALACGGDARREPERAPLAPELVHELELWRAGGAAWELERERLRADPALCAAFVDQLVLELVHAWDRSDFAAPGAAAGPFERARDELVALGPQAVPLLAALLEVGDGVVAYLAGEVLVAIGEPALGAVAARLRSSDEGTRRRAAELAGRIESGEGGEERALALARLLARHAADDPSWLVRGTALRALGERASRRAREGSRAGRGPADAGEDPVRALARDCARTLLRDPEREVAREAAHALGVLGDERVVPALIDALERAVAAGELPLAREAQASLEALTGAESASVEGWRRLWRERRAPVGR